MTIVHPTVPAAQAPPRSAPATASRHQNEVLSGLLHRCVQRDEAALARLYELTSAWIYALVTRRTSSAPVADDAMVRIYSKVWRQAARHPEHGQPILAWITAIACEETAAGIDAST